ncbi:MAG: hypothetical protein ACXAC7_03400 [Candidatus Hodarchaeales archaeon]|jgi:hypothetical protein
MILDISLIISIEQVGPVLRGTTCNELAISKAEAKVVLYFTQRVVFALGIGNKQVNFGRFHGPIELIDLKPPQEVIMLPIKFSDPNSPDPRIQNFGRDIITCIHIEIKDRELFQKYQEPLLDKSLFLLRNFTKNMQYEFVNEEEKVLKLSHLLKNRLNHFVQLRKEASEIGGSLFHLGTLRRLGEHQRIIGLALLESTKGMTEEVIFSKVNGKLTKENISNTLQELIEMGYIVKKVFENEREQVLYQIKE